VEVSCDFCPDFLFSSVTHRRGGDHMENPWEEISLFDYENHMKLESALQSAMLSLGYHLVSTLEHPLPNGKKLVQMDFTSQ
jgi:hypothetical protein